MSRFVRPVTVIVATLMLGCTYIPEREKLRDIPVERRQLDGPPMMRVCLGQGLSGKDIPVVGTTGPTRFLSATTGRELGHVPTLTKRAVSVNGGKVSLDSRVPLDTAVVVSPESQTVQVNGRTYRGELLIRVQGDGSMTLVNRVDLESYLRGVVASEMPKEWPLEALKVQAVASRTYAYAMFKESEATGSEFDLTGSFRKAQEYKGLAGESPASDRAVGETRGTVLTYAGKPFRTYFHSACGGHTEACGLIWDDYQTIAPLSGVDCPYCTGSKWYVPWRVDMTGVEIRESLKAAGRPVGAVRDVRLTDVNGEGHADTVEVVHSGGVQSMKGNDFRLAVGPGKLRSLRCRVSHTGDTFVFEGRGFGHGAGMCQHGVHGMVNQGRRWQDVLKYYYPGSEVRKVYP